MINSWQQALDRLFGLANWETRPPGAPHDFGLTRMRAFMADLGAPQAAIPAVHVAGTNGKGATCAVTASILRAAGLSVGLYTSPHLHTVRERAQVNGEPVPQDFVIDWLNAHHDLMSAHEGLTTFEALTALSLSYLASRGVDIAVVEVGLGGRLDSTRVVAPVASAITHVSLDHTAVLGDTVEAIAADKAGIMKAGVPCVIGPQEPSVRDVLLQAATAAGAPPLEVGRDVTWSVTTTHEGPRVAVEVPGGLTFSGRPRWGHAPRAVSFVPALVGRFQEPNLVSAVSLAVLLAAEGWPISDEAIACGASAARWPGRFELLPGGSSDPRGVDLLVDGAHNPAAARALADALVGAYPNRRRVLILGASQGKDVSGIASAVVPRSRAVIVTQSRHPRAMATADLAAVVADYGSCRVQGDPADALTAALESAEPHDLIVACGSLFVVAALREAWMERHGFPLPERDGPPR